VQFCGTVACDNFQNCSVNLWHNFMWQFCSSFFSADPLGVAPLFFMCFGFFEVVQAWKDKIVLQNCRINLHNSFAVPFHSTVLYDNFQNCSVNLWHNSVVGFHGQARPSCNRHATNGIRHFPGWRLSQCASNWVKPWVPVPCSFCACLCKATINGLHIRKIWSVSFHHNFVAASCVLWCLFLSTRADTLHGAQC